MDFGLSPRSSGVRWLAAVLAVGLHALVLAMVLAAPVTPVSPGQPDAMNVMFVELGSMDDAAPALAMASQPAEPEATPAPAPEPEAVSEPAPEPPPEQAITPPPKPRLKPVVKPPPKQVAKPRPVQTSKPKHSKPDTQQRRPQSSASAIQVTRADQQANAGAVAQGKARAKDLARPRTVGKVDYLGKRPRPVYPRVSQRRGEQGRVVLRVLISPQGHVAKVHVQRSSGHPRLDDAAVKAMASARFRPYTENGVAYKALVDIPFDFVL
ncbi:energy transducer TonB [Castellaniella sp. FW104-16D08]|uniref:energy transducer TonB n=1 Tax=unclassified Castellaniella TaxID=2617606 RepID=UPI003315144F